MLKVEDKDEYLKWGFNGGIIMAPKLKGVIA